MLKLSVRKSIALATLIAMPTIILAGDKVDETLTATSDGVVEIQNVRGKIEIVGWDKDLVNVSGELDDLADKLIFSTEGKVTLIRVEMPSRNINQGDGSNLVINIPHANRIDFNGVSTDILVRDIAGGIDIHTVSGDVDAINIKQQLFINTVSGDIVLKQSSGKVKLGSVSGDLTGEFDSKDISANSVSGDLKLKLQKFDSLNAISVSGDVWISGQLGDSAQAKLNSVNGDIKLTLTGTVNARVNAKAGPGGNISNKLTSDDVKDVFPNQQKLSMTLGDGSGQIKIGTVNGTITLNK